MGFYLPGTNQIRLRISYRAYETILQDIGEFQNLPEKEQISSFLNRVLKAFYQEAQSTIAEKKPKIYRKYIQWLADTPDAEALAEKLTEQELKANREQIRQFYGQPKKANGQNFKLIMTKATMDMLADSQEKELYNDSIPDYLAALIQEYTALPREERERLYFAETERTILRCIQLHHEAEITVQGRQYILLPFQVATNGFLPYCYVIGYAYLKEDAPQIEEKLLSFRLQRIQYAEEREQFSYAFTKMQQSKLKELMKSPAKITYLAGDEETISVRLTKKGLRLYQQVILSGRPACLEQELDADGGAILTFCCTQEQIFHYFIRFGKEAEILAPDDLRKRFAVLHQTAVGYYADII